VTSARNSTAALGLALALASRLFAQGPPPFFGQDERQAEPQMVNLNVVALDNRGQPITDLRPEELRITDAGRPQTIAFFRHRDESLAPPAALALNEVSNRGRGNVPRATMILFDMLNERFGTRGAAANQLIHDLESLESADYVYLYVLTLDGKLLPVHGMPGAGEEASDGGAPWTRDAKQIVDRAMRSFSQLRPVDDLDPVYRVRITYAALNAAAGELARAPGRKSLVWVTDGVPLELGPGATWNGESIDFTPQLRQMSEAFDRANVSIYPVRQVMLGSPAGMGGPGTTGIQSIDTLSQFAELTGGRPDAGKDIGAALRQAITDARTSYQVIYAPPEANWDEKFHKLRVTCTRKGVRLQAKTGYYAWREPSGARTEQAIASATSTTFDAAEVGLRAAISNRDKDHTVRLNANIDARDVAFVADGDAFKPELRYAIIAYAPGREPAIGPAAPLEPRLDQAARDKALRDGIPIAQNLSLSPETEKIRLVIFDRGSNAVGSVTLPVPK
jgi:VWFA-related protein